MDRQQMKKLQNEEILIQQEINRLILATFTAFWGGFILALFLGAVTDVSHEWISVLVSATAAAISGYAVYLVNRTLQATQDMANSQKHIGNLQTRAWLSYDSSEVITHPGGLLEFVTCIRNYGVTPARDIKLSCQAIKILLPIHLLTEDEEHVDLIDLPPTKGITCSTGPVDIPYGFGIVMRVGWKYKTTSGDDDFGSIFLILKVIDEKKQVQPLTQSDFYKLDAEYFCDSKEILRDFLARELIDLNSQFNTHERS